MQNRLFLLDAYALIYKAFYAFIKNPRMTTTGINTSAIYGFVNILNQLIENEKPTHISVVFDPPGPTFRHIEYPAYKANRPPTPEGIKIAVPYIKKILDAYNIPVIEVPGFEADDTIGTLAQKAEKEGFKVYMMTPDKDFCQLVTDNILIYKPKRSGNDAEVWDIDKVKEVYNIEKTRQIIDVLAMQGDSSDNIPGLDGVGEKKAKTFIKRYGSLEGLFENIEAIGGKLKEKILATKEQARKARELVTIALDVDIDFTPEKFVRREINKSKLIPLYEELEFKTLLKRMGVEPEQTTKSNNNQTLLFDIASENSNKDADDIELVELSDLKDTEHSYKLVDTAEKRKHLIDLLSENKAFCFDTETTGLYVHNAQLVGIAFAVEPHKAWYVPVPKDKDDAVDIVAEFKTLFEDENILKIGQNLKYDIMMLHYYNISVKGKLFDTMIAHYIMFPEQKHGMDSLAEQYLNYKPVPIKSLIGEKKKKQKSMRDIAVEKVKEYAAEDADITLQLKNIFEPMLVETDMTALFEKVEMPLVYVLAHLEINGFKLDVEALNEYADLLETEIEKLEKEILKLAGVDFNISSPKQLGEVLFDKMKVVSNPKLTKTKQYSTSEQELQKIADKHPIINKILEFRSLKKLLSTYVEALPELINKDTGKIHTSFNQAVVATGRLSSNNPNLQNIPIRTVKGRTIRKSFVASDSEHLVLAADYSQIELRLIAHLSKDPAMIEAFKNKEDIHTATAAKIFDVKANDVTKEMRSRAKSANFGIVYGISSFGLAQNLSISRSEAKKLIDGYFNTYPKVKKYMGRCIANARKNKYVETILGRKRALKDIDSQNRVVRGIAERNAINAPVQGSAADIIKLAMVNIYERMVDEKLKTKMILQVHDELIFDVYKPELDEIKKLVKEEMENAMKLDVPVTVDIGVGENWLEAH